MQYLQFQQRFTRSDLDNICVWTALVTPMYEDGSVDYDSLAFCVRRQEQAGNGIVILGSTGEGLALSEREQRRIVSTVMQLKPAVPVMAGVGGYQVDIRKDWIRYCQTQNVDAFLMVAPLYAKPGLNGQIEWFRTLMDQTTRPCMLYNVPSRTGINIDPRVFATLADHPNLWAVKDASGDIERTLQYQAQHSDLRLYSGEDPLMSEFAAINARGVVSVIANVWPLAARMFMAKCLNDQITLQSIQLWKEASSLMFLAANPIPAKAALAHAGCLNTPALRQPLSAEDMHSLEKIIEMDAHITHWYRQVLAGCSYFSRHNVA